jgi:putative MATE family efflux protein
MVIITIGNVITHMYFGLNAMLRATGHPEKSMYSTIFTVIINIVLSYLFIFVFNWGIRGAATATIIAQASMLVWQIKFYSNKKSFIHLQKGIFKLKRKIVKDSLSIRMSPFLMNVAACVIIIIINKQLLKYGGDLNVGAYGIINRVSYLFFMVVMGLNQGMQPIAGYNYGAKQFDRVKTVLKYSIILATIIMTIGFVIGEFFPRAVASVFTKDLTLSELAIPGLRIVFILFPIVGFQMVTSIFFESIGMVKKAIFMSLSRQVIFLLPCLLILPTFFGTNGIWYSLPISDGLASILAAYLLINQIRKFNITQQTGLL